MKVILEAKTGMDRNSKDREKAAREALTPEVAREVEDREVIGSESGQSRHRSGGGTNLMFSYKIGLATTTSRSGNAAFDKLLIILTQSFVGVFTVVRSYNFDR